MFSSRYELLTPNVIPKGFMDGRKACQKMVCFVNRVSPMAFAFLVSPSHLATFCFIGFLDAESDCKKCNIPRLLCSNTPVEHQYIICGKSVEAVDHHKCILRVITVDFSKDLTQKKL